MYNYTPYEKNVVKFIEALKIRSVSAICCSLLQSECFKWWSKIEAKFRNFAGKLVKGWKLSQVSSLAYRVAQNWHHFCTP